MGATYEVHERSMSSHAPSVALLPGKAWATVAQKMKTRYVATVRMLAVIIDNICRAAVLRTSSRLVRWNEMGVDHVSAALELYLSCGQCATGHGHNARTISQADAEMRLPARTQEGYTVKSRTRVTEGNRQSTKKADADRTCHVYASERRRPWESMVQLTRHAGSAQRHYLGFREGVVHGLYTMYIISFRSSQLYLGRGRSRIDCLLKQAHSQASRESEQLESNRQRLGEVPMGASELPEGCVGM